MSLILATGTNIGDKHSNLLVAQTELSQVFNFIAASKIFSSPAVDYLNQPDFYNQVLEFETPKQDPNQVMQIILDIEKQLGRTREINKGPRIIDIDIIFWDLIHIHNEMVTIPHPSWSIRSFVVKPLQQIPYFKTLKKHFDIPEEFNNTAIEIN